MPRLVISIVNWNTREQLRRCLRSLTAEVDDREGRIVVVDNASDDGSAAMVAREFPMVRLHAMSANLGFAAGNNVAIGSLDSEFVLVLNPDVEALPGAVAELLAFMERTPDAAAVSPVLEGPNGRSQAHLYRRFPSVIQLVLFWTILGPIIRRVPALRRRWFEHGLRAAEPIPVDQLPGAAMLVRRSVLSEIGEFDPDYFIWFEDVDWCYRARCAGHKLYVVPAARMRHEGGASFRNWSVYTRIHQFYRAFARFLCKHRLDHLRRWGLPILMADLMVKDAALRLGSLVGWPGLSGFRSLGPARAAVREVVRRYRQGELVRFGSAELLSVLPPSVTANDSRRLPSESAAPNSGQAASLKWRPDPPSCVDIVIVNWNGRHYLPACLEALARSRVPTRIVVVDNASTDCSVEYVRASHPDVKVLELRQNVGYAAGANAGLRCGTAEYAIVMNPDVVLAPDHLPILADRLSRDLRVGAAQGKLYRVCADDFVDGRLRPGGTLDSAGHAIRRSRVVSDRGQGQPDGPEFSTETSVFSACGAAIFLRRAMLDDVAPDGEYFDESFFAYKEDIDLCWRARLLGWDIRYVPGAIGYHVRAWAGSKLPPKSSIPLAARRHSWKNHYLLLLKNDRVPDLLRAIAFVGAWEMVRHIYALFRDPAVYPAYIELARLLPRALHRRGDVMARRRMAPAELRRWIGAGQGLECSNVGVMPDLSLMKDVSDAAPI